MLLMTEILTQIDSEACYMLYSILNTRAFKGLFSSYTLLLRANIILYYQYYIFNNYTIKYLQNLQKSEVNMTLLFI